jgi:hypothetical protein
MKLNMGYSILRKFINLNYRPENYKSRQMNGGLKTFTIDEFKQIVKNKENLIQMFELEGNNVN